MIIRIKPKLIANHLRQRLFSERGLTYLSIVRGRQKLTALGSAVNKLLTSSFQTCKQNLPQLFSSCARVLRLRPIEPRPSPSLLLPHKSAALAQSRIAETRATTRRRRVVWFHRLFRPCHAVARQLLRSCPYSDHEHTTFFATILSSSPEAATHDSISTGISTLVAE